MNPRDRLRDTGSRYQREWGNPTTRRRDERTTADVPPVVLATLLVVCPGFIPHDVVRRTHKAWVCTGTLDARSAFAKVLDDPEPQWARTFALEIRAYRYFATDPPRSVSPGCWPRRRPGRPGH